VEVIYVKASKQVFVLWPSRLDIKLSMARLKVAGVWKHGKTTLKGVEKLCEFVPILANFGKQ